MGVLVEVEADLFLGGGEGDVEVVDGEDFGEFLGGEG